MSEDNRNFIERADSITGNLYGEPMSPDRIAENFALYGLKKRVAALKRFDAELGGEINSGPHSMRKRVQLVDLRRRMGNLHEATHARNSGYFCRVGVLQRHWGRGLQLRLMRAVEVRARRLGWDSIVSDTTDNPVSANNFISAGYRLYEPEAPWAWSHTLYWRKWLR